MDPDGLIYVSDSFFSNIQVYTPEGRLLLPMGEQSFEPGAGHYALICVQHRVMHQVPAGYFYQGDSKRWENSASISVLASAYQSTVDAWHPLRSLLRFYLEISISSSNASYISYLRLSSSYGIHFGIIKYAK